MNRYSNWFGFLLKLTPLWLIPLFLLASCAEKDEAEEIRQLIREGAKFAEEHDARALMKLTTEDFFAQPGQHDHREVRQILWMAFRHYREFRVMYPEPSVDLEANGADASATVYFLIVRKKQSIPELDDFHKNPRRWLEEVGENADLYRLKLKLLKKDGDWLVRRALLEPFRGLGFSA
jgi:hypothetical protein